MSHSDAELEAMAVEYDDGVTAAHLDRAEWEAGPRAWLLDVVSDWEAFTAKASEEQLSLESLVRKAVDAYIHAA